MTSTPPDDQESAEPAVQSPHDGLFQYVFSDPEHAAGELRAVLPPALSRRVDWSSLRKVSGRLVDATLAQRQTDLLLSVRVEGREAFVYLLFEHQSTSDRWLVLRVLRYEAMVWDAYHREHPGEPLPPIVPVVLYHGAARWNAPRRLSGLFEVGPALDALVRPFVPDFELRIDDLSAVSTRRLYARSMTALARGVLHLFKRARHNEDIVAELLRYGAVWRQVLGAEHGLEAVAVVSRYLLEASDTPPARLGWWARQLGTGGEEAYMTGAEILRQQGRAEGEAKGRAEGEAKGRAEALAKLLELKFREIPAEVAERVRTASIAELDRWLERVLTAESLDEVLDR